MKFLDLVAQISEVDGLARLAAGRSLQASREYGVLEERHLGDVDVQRLRLRLGQCYLRLRRYKEAEELLIDRAQLLTLTAPEMTVLFGGLRVLMSITANPNTVSSPSGRRPSPTTFS